MGPSQNTDCGTAIPISIDTLLDSATRLADSFHFDDGEDSDNTFPARELAYLARENVLKGSMPMAWGGAGIGFGAGSHAQLLRLLGEIGRANLSLGRIYEGHFNALQLIHAYGSAVQQARAAADCLAGQLFAVWNTDSAEVVRIAKNDEGFWEVSGGKAFASAARWATRPLVLAEKGSEGRQMCLLRKEDMNFEIDSTSWRPIGMEATESFKIDLTGTRLDEPALIGRPHDYFGSPLFLGGSIRISALLMGGAEALFCYLRRYLRLVGQAQRPLQQLRVAQIYAAIGSGRGWVQYAAKEAEAGLYEGAALPVAQRMNFAANATRVAIEDICTSVIRLVSESVGARGLLQPFRFGRVIKDLTMLLRQPNPDDCRLETGKYLLEEDQPDV